jgi:hypothetical protein
LTINGPIWPSPYSKLLVRLGSDTSPGPTMISLAFLPLAFLVFRLDQWNDQ